MNSLFRSDWCRKERAGVRSGDSSYSIFCSDRKALSTGRCGFTVLSRHFGNSCGTRKAQTVLEIANDGQNSSPKSESTTIFPESLQLEQQLSPACLSSLPATIAKNLDGGRRGTKNSNFTESNRIPTILKFRIVQRWLS